MATVTITRGSTLPDSSAKADFHNLVDLATGGVSGIVNADIDAAASIADTKLATISTANKVAITALGTISGLTEKTNLVNDDLFLINDSEDTNAKKKVKLSTLVTECTFTPTAANALAGSIVQVKNVQSGTSATGNTAIPYDDTIPQNTEGTEFMTLAITPTSATNKLKISVVWIGAAAAGQRFTVALFQDTTANALACSSHLNASANFPHSITFTHYMTAGTTSETTFKVRAGIETTDVVTFNGVSGSRIMGGVLASSITIEEIKV